MCSIDVLAHNKEDLNKALNAAVNKAITHAAASTGRGILVTRHSYNSFNVRVTSEVPFGITKERDMLAGSEAKPQR